MNRIESIEQLEELYDATVPGAMAKARPHLSPMYAQWIAVSRFVILSTVGATGTDASPRGDTAGVVKILDSKTLMLPDWRGNNRLDSLRNIVEDGRVSLMFMVHGCHNVIRVNGAAILTADESITSQFNQRDNTPRTVIVITVSEVYFQCAKALMRSRLWESADHSHQLPTAGQFIKEVDADFDAAAYDEGYEDYARDRMW